MQDTITGFLIRTDGSAETVAVTRDESGFLRPMRTLIEAQYVDVVGIDGSYGPIDAWVDDEGAFTAIPNVAATVLLSELAGQASQPIFGRVLLLSREGADTTGLSADQIEYAQALHALVQEVPGLLESITRAHYEAALSGRR